MPAQVTVGLVLLVACWPPRPFCGDPALAPCLPSSVPRFCDDDKGALMAPFVVSGWAQPIALWLSARVAATDARTGRR